MSNSLRELLTWELIRRVPLMGDRRDHFEAETDVWEMVSRIAAGRKERELDPALAALRRCVAEARGNPSIHTAAKQRLEEVLEFTAELDRWYAQLLAVPRAKLNAAFWLGAKVIELLPLGRGR